MDVDGLTEDERVDLMRFLCSFAWVDGEVQAQERTVLERVLGGLGLSTEARAKASAWLFAPPDMEGFDFGAITPDKRGLFIDHAFEVASAHGGLAAEEMRHLQMFMRFADGAG
jgi:uncharacterized tellurite resistance protein B-like protein